MEFVAAFESCVHPLLLLIEYEEDGQHVGPCDLHALSDLLQAA